MWIDSIEEKMLIYRDWRPKMELVRLIDLIGIWGLYKHIKLDNLEAYKSLELLISTMDNFS